MLGEGGAFSIAWDALLALLMPAVGQVPFGSPAVPVPGQAI